MISTLTSFSHASDEPLQCIHKLCAYTYSVYGLLEVIRVSCHTVHACVCLDKQPHSAEVVVYIYLLFWLKLIQLGC